MKNKALGALSAFLLLIALGGCEKPGWSYPTGFDSFTAAQGYDTSTCNAFLSAAAVSFQSQKSDKAGNLSAIASMVAKVMTDHPETDVIVFHELCTSWLNDSAAPTAYYISVAEQIPGPTTSYIAGLASSYGVTIVIGLAEVESGTYYNSQAMLKPDGTLVKYRKRGLNEGDLANGCTAGTASVISDIRGIPVTFAICSDYQDESVLRDLSTGSAPVVLASLVTSTLLNNQVDYFARAAGKWVVYANGSGDQSGAMYPGNIFIADPTGTIHASASGPGAYSWLRIGVHL